MLKVGIVGFGFMGRMHFRCWQARDDAQVVAICDANPNIKEDAQKAVGNIDGAAEAIDFTGIELFSDFDAMLEKAELDAISLTLPTFLHAEFTKKALMHGLHVLCEKPMALHIGDCDRMIKAAHLSGKTLQIGHCLRFWPEYAKTKEIVASGQYGKIIAATFQRIGAPPTWSPDNWFIDQERSGGMALDLHIHDTDYIQYLLGMPKAVCSHGAARLDGPLVHIVTQYEYEDDIVVTAEGGWDMMPGFGFEMSFNLALEKATIAYNCARDPAFKVCPADGEPFSPDDLAQGDGYVRQIEYFAKTIQGQEVEPVLTLEQSRESVRMVEAEIESITDRKTVALN